MWFFYERDSVNDHQIKVQEKRENQTKINKILNGLEKTNEYIFFTSFNRNLKNKHMSGKERKNVIETHIRTHSPSPFFHIQTISIVISTKILTFLNQLPINTHTHTQNIFK